MPELAGVVLVLGTLQPLLRVVTHDFRRHATLVEDECRKIADGHEGAQRRVAQCEMVRTCRHAHIVDDQPANACSYRILIC